ncbi:MAG: porin [Rhodothermales bacterium]
MKLYNVSPLRILAMCLGMMVITSPAWSQGTKISGYMFGDFYYVASNHNEDLEERNGFWFRRIYLTFDQKIADNWSVRLRGEMSQPGDFTTKAKMTPVVKDAYLKWSNGQHEVYIALSSTPTWGLVEKIWGYRSVEKTPLDLYKFGSSRDIGLAAKGKLDQDGKVKYHVMVGNGSSNSSENNKGKKAMLSLAFAPASGVTLEAYTDYEARPGETDRYTFQGALFYQQKAGRVGVQFARQIRQVEDADNAEFDVLSVFGAVKLNEHLHAFARFDHQFQPNPSGEKVAYIPFSKEAEANFVVGGLDYAVTDKIHFMPNVEAIFYGDVEGGEKPTTDVIPRLTFYYKF